MNDSYRNNVFTKWERTISRQGACLVNPGDFLNLASTNTFQWLEKRKNQSVFLLYLKLNLRSKKKSTVKLYLMR